MTELDLVRFACGAARGDGAGAQALALAAIAFSSHAAPAVAAAVLAVLFALRRTRGLLGALVAGGLAIGLADPVNHWLLKAWIARPRPCHTDAALETLLACGSGWSFPSNHAANGAAAALAVVLAARLRGTAAAAVVCAGLLVGASRVVVGVHYPSDVVAGWAVGALVGAIAAFVAKHVVARAPEAWFAKDAHARAAVERVG